MRRFYQGGELEEFLSGFPTSVRSLMLIHEQSTGMAGSETKPSWWDREVDVAGRTIRPDVRLAAHEIWREACRKTEAVLADSGQASESMEYCVTQVSRYLDRQGVRLHSRKVNGLLMLAFTRLLQRRAARFKRLESVGGANDISTYHTDDRWNRQVEARIDLENIVRRLSQKAPRSWHSGTPVTTERKSRNYLRVRLHE